MGPSPCSALAAAARLGPRLMGSCPDPNCGELKWGSGGRSEDTEKGWWAGPGAWLVASGSSGAGPGLGSLKLVNTAWGLLELPPEN